MRALERLLDLLFPPKCAFCGRVLEEAGICSDCEAALPWAEGDEAETPLPGGTVCAAPLFYEGAVRQALLRLKFHGGSQLAGPLGERIARCAAERFPGAFDAVTWVPAGPGRRRRRGYDQAELLARAACRLWGVEPEGLLVKPEDNPAQSGQADAAARRANVLGVYAPAPGAAVKGRRILLIDDICTTGATLAECVRTLREAGAEAVVCAAAAKTRTGRERGAPGETGRKIC